MTKSKTSAAVKNRYAAKAYDRIALIVPKGRKQTIEAHAQSKGESINSFINRLLRVAMGLTDDEWKQGKGLQGQTNSADSGSDSDDSADV